MKKTILSMLLAVMTVGVSAVFTSCSSDDGNDVEQNVDIKPISMYVGDSHSIAMNFTPDFIASENDFIAKTDKSGNVNGVHVGSTNISIDSRFTIPVEIKGKINTYDDPVTEWGCSTSYVKSKQKQGTLREINGHLAYQNCGKSDLVAYMFENDKLVSVGVTIKSTYASEISKYLTERYMMIPYNIDDYTFMGFDAYNLESANTVVMLKVESASTIIVMYMSAQATNSSLSSKSAMPISNLSNIEKKLYTILQKTQD